MANEKQTELNQVHGEVIEIKRTREEFQLWEKFDTTFFKRYYTKCTLMQNSLEEEESTLEDITNEYYGTDFAELFIHEYLLYVGVVGASLLDLVGGNISRISNAYVEAHNKIIKVDVLH